MSTEKYLLPNEKKPLDEQSDSLEIILENNDAKFKKELAQFEKDKERYSKIFDEISGKMLDLEIKYKADIKKLKKERNKKSTDASLKSFQTFRKKAQGMGWDFASGKGWHKVKK